MIFVSAALLVAAHVAATHGPLLPQNSQLGMIVGRVVDVDSNAGIDNVVLQLQRDKTIGRAPSPAVISASDGEFLFTGLADGVYRVLARSIGGFLPATLGGLSPELLQAVVEVRADHRLANVVIPFRRAGSLSGLITDASSDQPIANVRVVAFRRATGQGPVEYATAGQAVTDDLGRYRIGGLSADGYSLCVPVLFATLPDSILSHYQDVAAGAEVEVRQLISAAASFGVMGGSETESRVIASWPMMRPYEQGEKATDRDVLTTTCYPAVRSIMSSQTITLTAGQQVMGLDITVTHERAARVSGSVVSQAAPAARAVVTLVPSELASSPLIAEQLATAKTLADDNGHFEWPSVPIGSYQLEARATRRSEGPELAQTEISSTRRSMQVSMDVSDTIDLKPGRTISGVIEVARSSASAPIDLSRCSVTLVPIDGHWAEPGVRVRSDRTFATKQHQPGLYKITIAMLPPGLVISTVTRGTVELAGQVIDLRDEDAQDIHISVAAGGMLRGVVLPPRGPAPVIAIIFQPARLGSNVFGNLRGAAVGPDGTFRVDALEAGEYCAVALDSQERAAPTLLLAALMRSEHCTQIHAGEMAFLSLSIKR